MTLEHRLSRAYGAGGSPIAVGAGGRQAMGSGPVERLSLVRPELPCPGCAHAAVCSIRPKLEGALPDIRTLASPHEAVTIAVTVAVTCQHFLVAAEAVFLEEPSAPDPVPLRRGRGDAMAASRQRGAKAGGFVRGAKKPLPDPQRRTPASERWNGPNANPLLLDPPAAEVDAGDGPAKRVWSRKRKHTDDEIAAALAAAGGDVKVAAAALGTRPDNLRRHLGRKGAATPA